LKLNTFHAGGSLTLKSSDPFEHPIVDPNFMASEVDLFMAREAMRAAQRFVSAPAWSDYIISQVAGNGTTDSELDDYIRSSVVTSLHGIGTAAMSPKDAHWGVVNPDLLVKGASGLRVVDASVLVSLHVLYYF
jgi:choline dehydrogenase-like flavoprotein